MINLLSRLLVGFVEHSLELTKTNPNSNQNITNIANKASSIKSFNQVELTNINSVSITPFKIMASLKKSDTRHYIKDSQKKLKWTKGVQRVQ